MFEMLNRSANFIKSEIVTLKYSLQKVLALWAPVHSTLHWWIQKHDMHPFSFNPSRMEVYLCHQTQNAKNIGNFMTLFKPHNIGIHLKGIETSF
jgi:hypothetical protein